MHKVLGVLLAIALLASCAMLAMAAPPDTDKANQKGKKEVITTDQGQPAGGQENQGNGNDNDGTDDELPPGQEKKDGELPPGQEKKEGDPPPGQGAQEPTVPEETYAENGLWDGGLQVVNGYWLPPVLDGFELAQRAVPIQFWLESAPAGTVSIQIREAVVNEDESVTVGDDLLTITDEGIKTRNKVANSAKTWGVKVPGAYYKYILKARDFNPQLGAGDYFVAVMVGDNKLLAFDNDGDEPTPALLRFTLVTDPADYQVQMQKKLTNEQNINKSRLDAKSAGAKRMLDAKLCY